MATGDDYIRYLNLDRIEKETNTARKLMKFGYILVGLFFIGILGCMFKLADVPKQNLPVYCILIVPSVIPILIAKAKEKDIKAARRYETIFGSDTDGIITGDELSSQLQKPAFKIFEELDKLFKKGFFQNCNLQLGGNPCVKIDNSIGQDVDGTGFVEVRCQNCGGTSRIRADSHTKCTYCGSPLYGKV